MPNTVRLHRVLAAKPEKVYRAFIEADALAKWLRRFSSQHNDHLNELPPRVGCATTIS